jgi:hypothetical protein
MSSAKQEDYTSLLAHAMCGSCTCVTPQAALSVSCASMHRQALQPRQDMQGALNGACADVKAPESTILVLFIHRWCASSGSVLVCMLAQYACTVCLHSVDSMAGMLQTARLLQSHLN